MAFPKREYVLKRILELSQVNPSWQIYDDVIVHNFEELSEYGMFDDPKWGKLPMGDVVYFLDVYYQEK